MNQDRRIPLKEKICKQLRQEIVFGDLAPNEHLREIPLSKRFDCTRGPVREALNMLAQQGFVTLVPNQGAAVKEPSAREVADFYNLMAVLEGKAVQWATPRLTADDTRRLTAINDLLKEALQEELTAVEAWIPLNIEFHRIFKTNCGNDQMDWLVEEIRIRITRYRYISLMINAFGDYAQDHDEIIDRVCRGEAELARQAMESHIHRARDILLQFLARKPARSL